jgi:hypothetical protein
MVLYMKRFILSTTALFLAALLGLVLGRLTKPESAAPLAPLPNTSGDLQSRLDSAEALLERRLEQNEARKNRLENVGKHARTILAELSIEDLTAFFQRVASAGDIVAIEEFLPRSTEND